MIKNSIFICILFFFVSCKSINDKELKITLQSENPPSKIVASYSGYDTGKGNTSLAFDDTDIYKWSGASPFLHEDWGYFDSTGIEIPYIKRDRDLGQTFRINGDEAVILKSIILRTGFGTNVVRKGMYEQKLSIQLFEVTGVPMLNINGSDSLTEAFHGFPHDRNADSIPTNRDDYFENETYTSIAVVSGGTFPSKSDFGFDSESVNVSPDDKKLKGKYLKISIPESTEIKLHPNKQYAFLLMIDKKGKDQGFTLANNYHGSYPDGHGIRRDGNGIFPPVPPKPEKDFSDPINKEAYWSAHFPDNFQQRCSIPPGTDGYPDVCTWRDLEFYIEAR